MAVKGFRFVVLVLTLINIQKGICTRPKYIVNKIKQTTDREITEKDKVRSSSSPSRTSSILGALLQQQHYDKRIRPDEDEKALDIGVNVYFNTLSSLDEENMEFEMDIYLRQTWIDKRLNYTHLYNASHFKKYIIVDPPEQVWTADMFLENSKQASFHFVTKKNEILRLWPNGTLFYSVRITAKVSCFMVLYRFPVDEQKCHVKFGSFKFTTEEVNMNWLSWGGSPFVHISPSVKLARYTISGVETTKEVVNYGVGGNYAYLVVGVSFKRDIGHYILQQYLPCSYIVLLSWVCFWIEGNYVGDRISIGVTLVLTIVLLQGALNTNMPKVSYSKYIDYYFNFCLAFLMASIIESLVVYKLQKMQANSTAKVLDPRISSQSLFVLRTRKENWTWDSLDDRKMTIHPSVKSVAGTGTSTTINISQKIDKVARMLFPVSFLVFNLIYHFYLNIV